LSTLNWRRDPGYEQSIVLHEQRRMQHELRMRQLRSDIERSKERTKLIEKEIEQLRLENARERVLSALIRQRCFPPESSSIPPLPTESDCGPSSR
jgi:hypothetical protein